MSDASHEVGYCRPPIHSRFQKGRSGNPGGKMRVKPEKRLKAHFEVALTEALDANLEVLRKVKPDKAIESLACQLVLQAADGRPSAQKIVLSIIEREADEGPHTLAEETQEDRPSSVFGPECRAALGDRFDEFTLRYDRAVEETSVEGLMALVEEFGSIEIPA